MESSDIKDRTVRLLYETMLLKKLSYERTGAYLGCTGSQVWRWIRKGGIPTEPYRKIIEDGIKRINLEIPGDKDGLVAWGRSIDKPEEDKFYNDQFPSFLNALERKVDKITRETFFFNDDYLHGFQEILFLALKHNVKLPTLKKRI